MSIGISQTWGLRTATLKLKVSNICQNNILDYIQYNLVNLDIRNPGVLKIQHFFSFPLHSPGLGVGSLHVVAATIIQHSAPLLCVWPLLRDWPQLPLPLQTWKGSLHMATDATIQQPVAPGLATAIPPPPPRPVRLAAPLVFKKNGIFIFLAGAQSWD